jgi:periplasmic divalent cation tolerance protein
MGIVVYITNPNMESARRVVRHLLDKKLIACANVFPMQSFYCWQGRQEDQDEIVVLAKTISDQWQEIQEEVKKIHPYKVPCIARWNVEWNKDYEKWVKKSLKEGSCPSNT